MNDKIKVAEITDVQKEYNKKYRQDNKEKLLRQQRESYEKNRDKILVDKKIYRAENKEKIIQSKLKYRQNNAEKIKEQKRRDYENLQNQDRYVKYLVTQTRWQDRDRERQNDIDFEYINSLIDKQNNKCVFSGVELVWKMKGGINQGSIDRIDSTKGHIKGNCQLITTCVNIFKLHLSDTDFKQLISNIKENYNKQNFEKDIVIRTNIITKHIKEKIIRMRERELIKKNKLLINKKLTIKDIQFDFDYNYIYELMEKQNNRCALTNVKMTWTPNDLVIASVDRIDSSKGYSKDNIQIVLRYVNSLKGDMSDDDTKQILEKIINHN